MENEFGTARGFDTGRADLPEKRTTAVGLFETAAPVDAVVREIEALGFPRNEVRILEEPAKFEVSGVMSFPRIDFETQLNRALTTIGATQPEAEAYIEKLRHGGALVFATGSDAKVQAAAEIMNRYGAVGVEKGRGVEPDLPRVSLAEKKTPAPNTLREGGRVGRIPPRGSAYFVW